MTYAEFVYRLNQRYAIVDKTPEERIADAMEKESQEGEKENG